ncbi:GIY-YIG nuclease family protein [Paraburkholderia sp. RCC_158]|uniref:GIY-YIG nuclease family protein n=1 Tax=Paraburkholderia sp. RCC_158 TaxID=3239220 RepID=UPI003525F4F4
MSERRTDNTSLIDIDARDTPGVYVIANLVSKKVYIGSSYKLRNRLTTHIWHLRQGKHRNPHLQSAWDKYGEEAFFFAPLEYVPLENLEAREGELIEQYRADSYNLRLTPESNRGFKHSPETKALMSAKAKVFCNAPEYRERVRLLHLGKTLSQESRDKISVAKRGKPLSAETRQKMRDVKRAPMPARTAEHNAKIAATKTRAYTATSPDGVQHACRNLRQFCKERGLDQSHMGKVARGIKPDHKGWVCRYA